MTLTEGRGGVCAARRFLAAGVSAGLKASGNHDLALIVSELPASVAGVFTTNLAAAAPVRVSKRHVAGGLARGVVVNSGGANACTGQRGLEDAEEMARVAGGYFGVTAEEFLVCSTGLIGAYLPMEKVVSGIGLAAGSLSPDDDDAARAIMTTDTVPKKAAATHSAGWTVGGIAKGAGMISPDMATMLGFLTTDAVVAPDRLTEVLRSAVDVSFNSITVDGDTSTNDTVLAFANGASGVEPSFEELSSAVEAVCRSLARQIVADGEGATKIVTIQVRGGASVEEAKRAARTVADSLLVKTAVYGGDANWGRVAGAVGRAGVEVDFGSFGVEICGIPLVERGIPGSLERIDEARKAMRGREVTIVCDLAAGSASAEVWTTDLTPEYVRLNAEYEL